jgi:repressor LexA
VLTKRQYELLAFLVDYQKRNALSPSYEEISRTLHLRSKSTVHGLVKGLEKRGYCKRVPNRARAIEILKTVEDDREALETKESGLMSENLVSVPFFGTLGAVGSLDILSAPQSFLKVVKESLPQGSHFRVFEVQGDFLKDGGILNGDKVVFENTNEWRSGAVVLVSKDQKLMIRKWEDEGHRVTLKTGNKYMIPEVHPKEHLCVHGALVLLSRRMA